ncbi:hypothetical protein ACO0K9_00925 [Undibacterium sp. Ji50W]|uniref:hypothetical protein n=1 Tax=Undibacterium sp. Ji50W TaxID=3413041 RepID=UPI003BF2E497
MNIGTLTIEMAANVARLQSDMEQAKQVVTTSMDHISKAVDVAKNALAGLGAITSIAGFGALIEKTLQAAAEMHRLSERTGVTVEALSALRGVARMSGTDMAEVATGMQKLSKNMVEAQDGTGKTAEAMKLLGISLKDSNGHLKSADQVTLEVAKSMQQYQDGAGKTAVAMNIFGKAGANLLPMLAELAEKGNLNGKMTSEQARQAHEFEKAITRLKMQFEGVFKTLALDLIPVITKLSQLFSTGIEIAAAYWAVFYGLPAVFGLATAALGSLQMTIALAKLEMAQGATAASLFASSVAGIVAPAEWAAGALGKLQVVLGVLFAAVAGWKIGEWLRDNFVEARLAGLAFVEGTLVLFEALKYGAGVAWAYMKGGALTAFESIGTFFADLMEKIGNGLNTLGASGVGQSMLAMAERMRTASASTFNLSEETARLSAEYETNKAAIHTNAGELAEYEIANAKAKSGTSEHKKELVMAAEAARGAESDYSKFTKSINEKIAMTEAEIAAGHALSAAEQARIKLLLDLREGTVKMTAAEVEAAKKKIDTYEADLKLLESQKEIQRYRDELAAKAKQIIDAATQEAEGLERLEATYGMTKTQIIQYDIARLQSRLVSDEVLVMTAKEIAALEKLIATKQRSAAVQSTLDGYANKEQDIRDAETLQNELDKMFDPTKGREFGLAIKGAVGEAISAVVKLDAAMRSYSKNQATYDKEVAISQAKLRKNGDMAQFAKNIDNANRELAENQLANYAQMAGAAKGFFNESSAGYRAMYAIEQTFQAFQLAMTLSVTAAKLLGLSTVDAATVKSTGVQVASDEVKGLSAAALAIATQAQGEPYTAWVRMAAMAAVMAGLGFAIGGGGTSGGGGASAADVQKTQGTGSVFGDATAKSDSMRKSLEILKENSNILLPVNQSMLASLRNIEASMTGLTNLLVRTPGVIEGDNMGIATGVLSKTLGGIFGSTTQNIVDSGIQYGGSLSGLQNGQGYNQYASVNTTSTGLFGWFGSTSNSVQSQKLSSELSAQLGLIFTGLESTLKLAANSLGSTVGDVESVLSNLSITDTKVSLKGLSGTALTDALNAVISKTMDEIAMTALPGLDAFRQVGEGYAQTIMRVASGIEVAKGALEKFGISAVDFKYITNKQGDVGAEIVRQSIMNVEVIKAHYDAGATGATVYASTLNSVGEIMQNMSGTASELIAEYQSLLDIRKLLRAAGTDEQSLGVNMIKGAGGQNELSNGLQTYADKFFTDAEKQAAAMKELDAQFVKLGITDIPKTHDEFRQLVESIDLTTAAGQSLYGGLVVLSDAFDSVSTNAEKAAQLVAGNAGADRLESISARRSADEAAMAIAKASADALATLTKAAQDSIPALLRAGSVVAALSANTAGVFNDQTFSNDATARFNAKASLKLAGQVSADALNTQDAGKVIADMLAQTMGSSFNASMVAEVKNGLGITMGKSLSEALDGMFQTAGRMLAMRDYSVQGNGIANVIAARSKLAFDSDAKSYGSASSVSTTFYGKDIQAYKDGIESLNYALRTGHITQDDYASGMAIIDTVMKDAKDLAGDMAAQLSRINDDAQRLVFSGLSSIGYYFGEITKAADALAASAAAANTPLSQTESAIGRLTSLATVMGQSVSAVAEGLSEQASTLSKQMLLTQDEDQQRILAAQLKSVQRDQASILAPGSDIGNADLIARSAAAAAAAMTTADGSKAAAALAGTGAFAGSSATQLRDFALLLDGVKQFDPTAFENSFTRMNAALIKGIINQDQYNALFGEGLGIFNTGKTSLEAAQAAAAQAAKVTTAATSAQTTAALTLANTFATLQKAAQSLTDSLLLDNKYSPLTPEQMISEAARQYYATLDAAMGGDASAASQYQSVAQAYLSTLEANASSQSQLDAGVGNVLANDSLITRFDTANKTNEAILSAIEDLKKETAKSRAANESSAMSDNTTASILTQFRAEGIPPYVTTP